MAFQLDTEWHLQPIKGATGQTYMGIRATERVFIKRNTSPLLAALSKEGIAPKLVWTKRTVDGDTLTAQEWLEGRLLQAEEIGKRNDVIDVLYHLHHSHRLKKMLEKIGGHQQTPACMLNRLRQKMPEELQAKAPIKKVTAYLAQNLPAYDLRDFMVVHGDVNHRNWLVSNNYLYLVDWDSVMLADPALDLGMLLGHYVPRQNWNSWLLAYGLQPDVRVIQRIQWYALVTFLQEILRFYQAQELANMREETTQMQWMFKMIQQESQSWPADES